MDDDVDLSRAIYNRVVDLCMRLGSNATDLVPFEKYAAAAQLLGNRAPAARTLMCGAKNIERTDKLVPTITRQKGPTIKVLDAIVGLLITG